ncbi:MAG: hypothetical protein H6738_02570 [Alphaproteobacteria bacterium]|nr:hypothetical protein [Alphaproteobacteria bacterium]MCB9695653.1 hypothetical protein [Alphaproteobacteria bacterium]
MDRRSFLRQSTVALAGVVVIAGIGPTTEDLQSALDAAAAEGRPLVLPPGTWSVSRTLRVPAAGLRGAGAAATVLVAAPGLVGPVLEAAEPGAPFAASELSVEGAVRTRIGSAPVRFTRTV